MFKVKTDIEKNRLIVTLIGLMPVSDAKKTEELILKGIEELQPGFDFITDFSRLIRGEEEDVKILQELMLLITAKKVNRVVRVVGTSKTGLLQFANNSLKIESYKLKYVPTIEDAESFLDKKEEE
ncbi:MAG: hypothetical protein P4L45_02215 [Ignavibacteriaceae bacterium]|nr:hypothetical protein [Ignavibacteriaceae bacterium]